MSGFKKYWSGRSLQTASGGNLEELAAWQRGMRRPEGGIMFARNEDGEQKTAARQLVLDLFHPDCWPYQLHMLTLPGLDWTFERQLWDMRQPGWQNHSTPRDTYVTACENDRAVFYASAQKMPGLSTKRPDVKQIKRSFDFAETAVKTRYANFFFANVDDFMGAHWQDGWWNAVWLDYTGPLTVERLLLIRAFYHRHVKSMLIVTALKARWTKHTSKAIAKADGHSKWLRHYLDGEVLHDIEYCDTSPMAQFAVRKR